MPKLTTPYLMFGSRYGENMSSLNQPTAKPTQPLKTVLDEEFSEAVDNNAHAKQRVDDWNDDLIVAGFGLRR